MQLFRAEVVLESNDADDPDWHIQLRYEDSELARANQTSTAGLMVARSMLSSCEDLDGLLSVMLESLKKAMIAEVGNASIREATGRSLCPEAGEDSKAGEVLGDSRPDGE